jgi:hypothetical protein
MGLTYLGPATAIDLGNGRTLKRGGSADHLSKAARTALEKAGHRFKDSETGRLTTARAAQSAAENLAAQGTTAEQQAAESGLSVGSERSKK